MNETVFPSFKDDGMIQDDHGFIHTKTTPTPGMTLRDYFAAAALSGLLANSNNFVLKLMAEDAVSKREIDSEITFSRYAFETADAMIAERSKTPGVDK